MARHYNEEYAGIDERRAMEARDSRMIGEDRSAIANLPQQVIMKEYPKMHGYLPENLDDTDSGIMRQVGEDNAQKMRHLKPKKV